jgi:predicted lysophospholipase L1 biosynthesis ABC-type transport system permease subunit
MGIPILQGRDFSRSDPDSLPGVIISRATALAYWPGENPLGARIRVFGGGWLEVIGVAADVRARDLATEPERTLYLPPSAYTAPAVTLVVAARGDPMGLVPAIREQVRRIDRGTALTSVITMDEVVAESLAQQRFNALLLGGFSLAALALAVLGLYGVISFGVARRAREFGVRLALGAEPGGVQRMVLREGLALSLAGVGAGIAGAVALSRVVSRLVYGAAATDPVTLASVALLLTAVTLLATLLPARRAMRVDPAVVLREE